MEYSKQLKKQASQFSVPVPTLIMADLVIAGYSEEDAYNIAYAHNSVLAEAKRDAQRQQIVNNSSYQRILAEKSGNADFSTDSLIDSETALKQLLRQIQKMPDGKEKADLYAKYLESMRKSSTQPEEEDDRVQIYLPLKCRDCSLFQSYKQKPWKIDLNPKIPQ